MQTKRCPTCKETKPVSEFGKNRSRTDGLCQYCKRCTNELARTYREANKEKVAETGRRYREANKEKVAEMQRRYREGNKEKVTERRSNYYKANKSQENRRSCRHSRELNNLSLELAHRQGQPWEDWEHEFIMADNGLTVYQKAVKLGRSYRSVAGRRRDLRKKARAELTTDDYPKETPVSKEI